MVTRRDFLSTSVGIIAGTAIGNPIRGAVAARNGKETFESLPYDSEVEYIESTGKEYITLVQGQVDNNIGLEMVYSMNNSYDNYPAGFSTTSNRRFLFWGTYSGWRYGWHDKSTSQTSPTCSYNSYPLGLSNFYSASLNYLNDGMAKFDDKGGIITGYGRVFTNTNFLLFRSYSTPIVARIKSAKLSWGTVVIRDMKAVRFTNEVGITEGALYDRVTGELFRNAGTGSFIIGPDV